MEKTWGISIFLFLYFFIFCIHCRGFYESKHTTHNKGAGDKRGGRGKDKTVRNRNIRRSVEGRRMRRGTWGIQDGHHRDFQHLTQQGTFWKEGREFEGGGFGVD